MLDTLLALENVVKAQKHVKAIQAKKSKVKEVPNDIKAKNITNKTVDLSWTPVAVKGKEVKYQVVMKKAGLFNRINTKTVYEGTEPKCTVDDLEDRTGYEFWVRCGYCDGGWGKWSEKVMLRTNTPFFSWKECPDNVISRWRKYSVDEKNPRIATKTDEIDFYDNYCAIIGNTPLPLNKVTLWDIKILNSKNNNGLCICIGVAHSYINVYTSFSSYSKCGWYFSCYSSTLFSGPPHNYNDWKEYGSRKECGKYVHTGDSVGVVMDTTKGELSFVLSGVNLGVAYDGIPLDEPLLPCVLLRYKGDSVELII